MMIVIAIKAIANHVNSSMFEILLDFLVEFPKSNLDRLDKCQIVQVTQSPSLLTYSLLNVFL